MQRDRNQCILTLDAQDLYCPVVYRSFKKVLGAYFPRRVGSQSAISELYESDAICDAW
mgnify:CR=1 FL=1